MTPLTDRERKMFDVLQTVLVGLYNGSIKAKPLINVKTGDMYGVERLVMDALAECDVTFSDALLKKFPWTPPASRALASLSPPVTP